MSESAETEPLLERIGGDAALEATVEAFYGRLVADEDLKKFFEGVPLSKLKNHQVRFLKLAFTKVPESIDVPKLMLDKHARLFAMGLNETHFDIVAGHLVGALESLSVPQPLIDEVVGIVGPLRPVFEEGAKKAAAAN